MAYIFSWWWLHLLIIFCRSLHTLYIMGWWRLGEASALTGKMFPFSLRGTTPSVALIPFSDSRSREVLTHPGKMHPVSVQLDDTPRWLWRLVWERSCIDTSEEDQFPCYGTPPLDGSAISCSTSLHLTSEPMSLLYMSFLSIHFKFFLVQCPQTLLACSHLRVGLSLTTSF